MGGKAGGRGQAGRPWTWATEFHSAFPRDAAVRGALRPALRHRLRPYMACLSHLKRECTAPLGPSSLGFGGGDGRGWSSSPQRCSAHRTVTLLPLPAMPGPARRQGGRAARLPRALPRRRTCNKAYWQPLSPASPLKSTPKLGRFAF